MSDILIPIGLLLMVFLGYLLNETIHIIKDIKKEELRKEIKKYSQRSKNKKNE